MKSIQLFSRLVKTVLLCSSLLLGTQAYADDSSAQVNAVIESVMLSKQMVKITHDPIPAWSWPKMKMKFAVSPEVDLKPLSKGQKVTATLQKGADGKAVITAFE